MANPRTRKIRPIRIAVASITAALVVVGLMPSAGSAAPKLTLAQAQAQMAAYQTQAEAAQEAYDNAQVALAAGKKVLKQIQARVARSQAAVSAAQVSVGRLASAAHRLSRRGDPPGLYRRARPDHANGAADVRYQGDREGGRAVRMPR